MPTSRYFSILVCARAAGNELSICHRHPEVGTPPAGHIRAHSHCSPGRGSIHLSREFFLLQARASAAAAAAAMGAGGSRARQNAMRSGVVVLGAVAFGYLSFRVGFKPYLDQAQEAMNSSHDPAADASDDSGADDRPGDGADLAPSDKDPAVVLRD